MTQLAEGHVVCIGRTLFPRTNAMYMFELVASFFWRAPWTRDPLELIFEILAGSAPSPASAARGGACEGDLPRWMGKLRACPAALTRSLQSGEGRARR